MAPADNPASLGAFAFNLRFPGQYADAETGLSYSYFRHYAPSIGRYAQSDPIGLDGTTLLDQIAYAPFGGPLSWNLQMASGAQANQRIFDTSGRLVRYRLGNTIRGLTYDAAERIVSYKHDDATSAAATPALDQSFGYDELGRLTSVSAGASSWSIGYDANGNRTGVTLNGTASTYATSSTSNRLTSTTNPARSFGYDNAGNTTGDGSYTASYTLAGTLSSVTRGGVTASFDYDANSRRVRKFNSTGSGSTVLFVYDQAGQILGEYDSSGAALREYVWLGSTAVAVFTPDPASGANPPLVYFIHADHIDTPRVIVDANNNVRWRWLAEPFGTSAPETDPSSLGPFAFNLRFPGQYADAETGLAYNYFRHYDPSIGRYTQSDPIGLAGGINTYAYVNGNPISFTDPRGLVKWFGSVTSVAAVDGVGAGGFKFDLTSECKCGVRMHIQGFASTLAAGIGLTYTGSTGSSEFSDIFPCPLANAANGPAGVMAVSSVGGVYGASYGAMKLGSLSSGYPSLSKGLTGLDLSAGVYLGWSVVTSSSVTKCDECEAGKQ
jgi:RHS repeat-associated protein